MAGPDILALDIATKTGWASRIDGMVDSGVVDLKADDLADMGWSLHNFLAWRLEMSGADTRVYIERPWMGRNGDVTYRLMGLSFVAHMTVSKYNFPRFEIPPKSLKEWTTGDGAASKKLMMATVEEWGFQPMDDNESDAIALLTYAIERHNL